MNNSTWLRRGIAAALALGLTAPASFCVSFRDAPRDTPLRGPQDGEYACAEYVVDSAIVVPAGKTMTIAAGSIIRFKRYAQMRIEGRLESRGTPASLVLFTSDNHRPADAGRPQPTPFDWNGIVVASGGALRMSYARVAYSTMGIKCESPMDSMTLDNVAFSRNGTQSLSVMDSVISVPESRMVSIGVKAPVVPAAPVQQPAKPTKVEPAWKLPVRIGGGALLAGGAVLGVYAQMRIASLERQYDTSTVHEVTDRIKRDRNAAAALRGAGLGLAGLGAVGVSVTFLIR